MPEASGTRSRLTFGEDMMYVYIAMGVFPFALILHFFIERYWVATLACGFITAVICGLTLGVSSSSGFKDLLLVAMMCSPVTFLTSGLVGAAFWHFRRKQT